MMRAPQVCTESSKHLEQTNLPQRKLQKLILKGADDCVLQSGTQKSSTMSTVSVYEKENYILEAGSASIIMLKPSQLGLIEKINLNH